jgi:predicted nucleic acid-binding protein
LATLSIHLDTSAIVPLFVNDAFTARMRKFLVVNREELVISDFAAAEFVSAIGIRVRSGDLSIAEAKAAFANFDNWTGLAVVRLEIDSSDIAVATTMLRRLDLRLRAPDAVHLAMAERLGAKIATFDKQMANAANRLGISVAKA